VGRVTNLLKSDTLLQSVSVALILTIVGRVVSLGRGFLLARVLDPSELGQWALMIDAVYVLSFFLLLGIPSGLSRYVETCRREGTLRTFLFRLGTRAFGATLIICLAGLFFHKQVGSLLFGDSESGALVVLTLTVAASLVVFGLLQGVLHGLRLFRLDSWIELLQSVGFLAIAGGLLFWWRRDAIAGGMALLIVTLLAAVVVGWIVWRQLRTIEATEPPNEKATALTGRGIWWGLIIYSLGMWSAGSLQSVWQCIDRYMLLHLSPASVEVSLAQIGDYFIISRLAAPIAALVGMVGVVLLPHAAQLWERRRRKEVVRLVGITTKLSAVMLTFFGGALVLLKPYAFWIIAGRMPVAGSAIYELVIVTVVLVSIHYVIRTYLLCAEKTWWVAGVWLGALAVNFALNYFLIPRYQIYGAALATFSSAGVALFAIFVTTSWHGMRVGVDVWAASASCFLLFIPANWVGAALLLLLLTLLSSNLIFSQNEKQEIDAWLADKLSFLPGLSSSQTASE